MEANIQSKAMQGIERFLERRGMEIIERGWAHGKDKVDFIADDEGDLVFISCTIRTNDGNGLDDEEPNRKRFERIASTYLAEHLDLPESTIRHDIVSMLVLSENRALIRHHRNALSETSNDLG
jgi:putative endonuclease